MEEKAYKERILVVDDIQLTHAIFKKILAEAYHLTHAMNGREALNLLQNEEPPDLVLLDIMMPEMNGYELFDEMKKDNRLANIPVIFVTALDSEADEIKGLETGAVDYIIKPIDKITLVARIEYCLEFTRFLRYQQSRHPEVVKSFITGDESSKPFTEVPSEPEEETANILLVDNDTATIKAITDALGDSCVVNHQRKGADIAKRLNPAKLPDLILMDVLQSGFDGFKLIQELKEQASIRDIPIIFMTARRSKEAEAKGFEMGCVDYITKPINPSILRSRVRIHLKIARQRKAFEQKLDQFLNT